MSQGLTRILKPASAVAGFALLAASAGVLTQSSETLLRSSFQRALGPASPPLALAEAGQKAPIAGTEEFWLTAMGRDASVTRGVSLGDRITLTLGGKERSFRVTSVSDIAPAATHIDTPPRNDRLVLVTAKDTADALSRPIRFVIDLGDTAAGVLAPGPARAS
jgi:hypothetical protein